MANDISGRPWLVDTVGLVKSGPTFTTGFVFRDYTGGGASKAFIKDGRRNKIVAKLYGDPSGAPVSETWLAELPSQTVWNLTIDATSQLDTGVVEIIVR